MIRFISIFIAPTFIFINAHASCADSFNPNLLKSLSKLGVQVSTKIQTDYANLKHSHHCYFQAFPHNTKEVAAIIDFAYKQKLSIRIQGNSHSENGSSLPQFAELLIHTDYLNAIKFEKKGEVTAGAGIPLFLLNNYIREKSDYALPVYNGGGMGPTLGGYISAGGISCTSKQYGGFWNHVHEITIVIANGKILRFTKENKFFPWIFGSMGQLGVITEAKLGLILQTKHTSDHYPLNKQDHISYQHQDYFSKEHKPLYWFNLFVDPAHLNEARLLLTEFQAHHPGVLNYYRIYEWPLNHNQFVPPLIFPGAKNFYALGTWGVAGSSFNKNELSRMEKEFDLLVINKHYHRYIQAELANKPAVYADYFGPKTLRAFRVIKAELDPEFLFNVGSVFKGN